VALEPASEQDPATPEGADGSAIDVARADLPAHVEHPHEQPSDWGWHADFGKQARIAGWITVVLLILMTTSTHYNGAGAVSLLATAAVLVIGLLWDMNRRRKSWRD
jgi:hypothetical protein